MGEWDDAIEDGHIDPTSLSPTDHPDIERALRRQHDGLPGLPVEMDKPRWMDPRVQWFEVGKVVPDGRYPVLLWDGEDFGVGMYTIDMNEWELELGIGEPTHWTYLPAPPK